MEKQFKNRAQQVLYYAVCQIRNSFFNTPSLSLVEEKLVHVRRLAKENNEEEYLKELLKEEFK
jgi:hypothetical protein